MTKPEQAGLREKLDSRMGPCLNCNGKWVYHADGSKVICSHVEMLDDLMQLFEATAKEVIGTSLNDPLEPPVLNKMFDAYNSRIALRQEQRQVLSKLLGRGEEG